MRDIGEIYMRNEFGVSNQIAVIEEKYHALQEKYFASLARMKI